MSKEKDAYRVKGEGEESHLHVCDEDVPHPHPRTHRYSDHLYRDQRYNDPKIDPRSHHPASTGDCASYISLYPYVALASLYLESVGRPSHPRSEQKGVCSFAA